MIGPWERLECSSHDDELDAGVEARVADPLWLLARQWQTGELRGDDAASPIAARLEWRAMPLRTYRPSLDGPVTPMPTIRPLERVVEAAPPPRVGSGRLHWATRLAAHLSRRLARDGRQDAIRELTASFALSRVEGVALPGAGTTAAELLRRRSFDGAALLAADEAALREALTRLDPSRLDRSLAVIRQWQADATGHYGTPPVDTWDETRLEHSFSIGAGVGDAQVTLTAREHTGGHLDWYSFDVESKRLPDADSAADERAPAAATATAIPTPVRYSGMPAPRWWAFEAADVHFGDIAAAPGDLGRLLLADFATIYGNDWYSIPLRLPIGTLCQILELTVHDTMGGHRPIAAAATLDRRKPGRRSFRLYELTGDPSVAAGRSPLLLLPPSVSGSARGPAVERVELVRDEAANLAWGVERFVQGPLGLAVDRLQHWRTAPPRKPVEDAQRTAPPVDQIPDRPGGDLPGSPVELPDKGGDGTDGGTADRDRWRYRLESAAPPFWVPFVPVRIGSGAQVRLRRARMQEWQLLAREFTGPKGELLQPRQPMFLAEEEVPRGGATLERRWQAARWTDGSLHVWIQRSKELGHGERSSGLQWDSLTELPDEPDESTAGSV